MPSPDPYRNIARIYDRLIEPMQAGVRHVATKVLPPRPGWHVLDVGCGTGTGMTPYLDAGCTVTGVDTSEAMLERAGQRLGDRADVRLTDGKSLPFADDEFDLVTTTMVLHEIPDEARPGFVTEMARVAKPDGRLLIIDFHFESLRGWKGPTFRMVSWWIELFSGHYLRYRSFKRTAGVPSVVAHADLAIEEVKVLAGGNVAVYLCRRR